MSERDQKADQENGTARPASLAPRRSLAFVSSLPGWGGGEKWMLSTARTMRDRGHAVTLIVQPASELANQARYIGIEPSEVRLGGIFDPRSLMGLGSVLRRRGVEVVCANLDKEIRQVRLAASLGLQSIRLVARRGSPDPIKNNWHYRLQYEQGVDRLICNCEALVESVCAQAPWFDRERIRVIYNGVDVDALELEATAGDLRAELGLAPATPVVACVGEVGWRKGQDLVLSSARALSERMPDLVWLIAGNGAERIELTEQARRMGLLENGRVRFLGFRRDVPAVIAAADLLVLPSRVEGFPNTLLEGMALERPVAASSADGIPELVEHEVTGLLHPTNDGGRFTGDVERLMSDAALRERFGAAGRRRVLDHFTERAVMDETERCLCDW